MVLLGRTTQEKRDKNIATKLTLISKYNYMRAGELMIGDWVFNFVCEEEKIKPVQVIEVSIDGIQCVYKEGDEILSLSYEDIAPMSLDEDILKLNKWKGGEREYEYIKGSYKLARTRKGWDVYYYLARIAEIRFVHELQNIMRMTGYQGEFKV